MTGRLTVWVLNQPCSSYIVSSTQIDPPGEESLGEMRLRFRKTYRPERLLFSFKSLYHGLDPETGFSGFCTRGDVLIRHDGISVRPKVWTGCYHLDKQGPACDPWYGF